MSFYFNANACRLSNYFQLFDPNTAFDYTMIFQAHLRDVFSQGLNQIYVTGADDFFDSVDHILVANDIGQLIRSDCLLAYIQIDIDPYGLGCDTFEGMNTDLYAELKITDENVTNAHAASEIPRLVICRQRHLYSLNRTGSDELPRCWPASRAII